ncbi:MAG: hypothetical protein HQM02_02625 [Magnetococcales bacterium]|nr:hypothetical protein [Magnetococcales bacterium]
MQLTQQPNNRPLHPVSKCAPRHHEGETRAVDDENARRLWAAVMERAILDLHEAGTRGEAVAWISSKRMGIGSFHWICNQLDMDPGSVKRALLGQKTPISLLHRQLIPPPLSRTRTEAPPLLKRVANLSNA